MCRVRLDFSLNFLPSKQNQRKRKISHEKIRIYIDGEIKYTQKIFKLVFFEQGLCYSKAYEIKQNR